MRTRRFHVVAIGITAYLIVLVVFNLLDEGALHEAWSGDVVAVGAGIAAATIITGWLSRHPKITAAGLLVAALVITARSLFLLFVGPNSIGIWLGLSVAFIAAGTYVRETHALDGGDRHAT